MTITIKKAHLALIVLFVALIAPSTAVATHIFADVPDDAFFAESVAWAFENEITTGKGPSTFDPLANVTRGESVTFDMRYDTNIVQPALSSLQMISAGNAADIDDNAAATLALDNGLGRVALGGNGQGVGGTICTVGNSVEIIVINARGERHDARFSYIVPDFDYGQVRNTGSVRSTAGRLLSVEHPGPGQYCLVFNSQPSSIQAEATIVGIHANA